MCGQDIDGAHTLGEVIRHPAVVPPAKWPGGTWSRPGLPLLGHCVSGHGPEGQGGEGHVGPLLQEPGGRHFARRVLEDQCRGPGELPLQGAGQDGGPRGVGRGLKKEVILVMAVIADLASSVLIISHAKLGPCGQLFDNL